MNDKIKLSGLELIVKERQEQIEKHGWTKQHDAQEHEDGELVKAAFIIGSDSVAYEPYFDWAFEIREHKQSKYEMNDPSEKIERLAVAGALLAAEIDRLQSV